MALSLLLAGSGAAGQPSERPVADAIDVGPGACLDRATLALELSTWLGRATLDPRIAIAVRETPEGVLYTVTRDGAPLGARALRVAGMPCPEVHAAAALGIAVAIDATILTSLGILPPAHSPPVPLAPPPPPPAPAGPILAPSPNPASPNPPPPARQGPGAGGPPPGDRTPAEAPPRLGAALEGIVLVGVLPEVALGLSPGIDLRVARTFDLRASALGSTDVSVPIREGEATLRLIAGRLDACAALRTGPARFRGCAGVAAGVVGVAGSNYPTTYVQTAPWIGPALRFDGRWAFGRAFGLVFSVDGFIPGLRPRLDVLAGDGSVAVSRTFPLAGVVLGLGPSIAFW